MSKKYTEQQLQYAIEAVKNGMPYKSAAKKFNVPRATIQFRCSSKFTKTTRGPGPVLGTEEEDTLIRWIKECHRKGFPRRKQDVQLSVQEFLEVNSLPNPFKDNIPGDKWYKSFLRRHPDITVRTSEAVTTSSANVTESDIRSWFTSVESLLKEENFFDIIEHPERVFNADETSFLLDPKKNIVLAPTGAKDVYEVDAGKQKSSLTVLFTFSGSGSMCPPLIVYPLMRISEEIVRRVPANWGIGRSDSGWMKAEIFYEFIANVFSRYLNEENIKRPVILFVDGHKTHLTYKVSNLCKELKIVIVALYPNSTRILQPADVAAFRPVKAGWKNAVLAWRKDYPCKAVRKEDFAVILKGLLDNLKMEKILKNGFRATGLYPWNADAVNYKKCLGKQTEKNTETELCNSNSSSMTYENFLNIVGEKRIKKFQNIKKIVEQEENNEEFFVLYRLWEYFQESANEKLHSNESSQLANPENAENLFIQLEQIEHAEQRKTGEEEQAHNEKPNQQEDQTNEINEIETTDDNLPVGLLTDVGLHVYTTVLREQDKLIKETCQSKSFDEIQTEETESGTGNGGITSHSVEPQMDINENPLMTTPKKNLNSTLSDILTWPETPKRKGKRNTERIPYVVTSSKWSEIQEKKIKEKLDLELEKERKRMERQLKKEAKQAAQATKLKKRKHVQNSSDQAINIKNHKKAHNEVASKKASPVNVITKETIPKQSTVKETSTSKSPNYEEKSLKQTCQPILQMCYNCTSTVKQGKGQRCSRCEKAFHNFCIPVQHRTHIPDESDEELYLCHMCYDVHDESDDEIFEQLDLMR